MALTRTHAARRSEPGARLVSLVSSPPPPPALRGHAVRRHEADRDASRPPHERRPREHAPAVRYIPTWEPSEDATAWGWQHFGR